MIDIHCHILPGFDDGPKDTEQSLRMAEISAEQGVRTIVATPHSFNGVYSFDPQHIITAVLELNERLKAVQSAVRILPGMEVHLVPDIETQIVKKKVMGLNGGRYILLELPYTSIPQGFENLIDRLCRDNIGIVLGHPERNLEVQKNPDRLLELLRQVGSWDLLLQISGDSILGDSGKEALKSARFLLKSGAVHLIGSDAHSPTVRTPKLAAALHAASRIVGKEKALKMVRDIPRAVLTGEGFPSTDITERRTWWSALTKKWFGRQCLF